jgi:hypothetical protein
MASLNSDIDVVVARTVKIALALLLEGTDKAFLDKVVEPGCSILFIGNEKGFFIYDQPFQEVWGRAEINPECTCQTLEEPNEIEDQAFAAGQSNHGKSSEEYLHDEPNSPQALSEHQKGE